MVAATGFCWIAVAISITLFFSKVSEIASQPKPDMFLKWMIITGGTVTVSFLALRILNARIALELIRLESRIDLKAKVKNLQRVYTAVAVFGSLAFFFLLFILRSKHQV